MQIIKKFKECIERTKKEEIFRQLPENISDCVDFSSNDYLGLAKNHRVIQAGCEAALKYGAGSTGSRLLSGNKEIFMEFEKLIAEDKKAETALIFNSGFQANSGVLECLSDSGTVVFFDRLNHASMYQGVFASKAELLRYRHLDYDHLKTLLAEHRNQRVLIVSETVFGMDGDIADLKVLSELANEYGAVLYLDEAHATGLYGKEGYGLSTDFSLDTRKTVIMGTFSKALGSSGAYVACSNLVKDYILQKCRSFIYSTALSPFCVGAALQAWKMVRNLNRTRQRIMKNSEGIRRSLKEYNYNVAGSNTNIIPVIFDRIEDMLKMKRKLKDNGVEVSGIRRPTSPTPRLRIAINAGHTTADLEKLLGVLIEE